MDAINDSWIRHCGSCYYLAYVRLDKMTIEEAIKAMENKQPVYTWVTAMTSSTASRARQVMWR